MDSFVNFLQTTDEHCYVLVKGKLMDVIAIHIRPQHFVATEGMEGKGCFENIINLMSSKCSDHWHFQIQTIAQLSIRVRTVFILVVGSIGIDDIGHRVDEYELLAFLIIDIGNSEISLVGSASLILEIILELAPWEPLEKSLQFEGNDIIGVSE